MKNNRADDRIKARGGTEDDRSIGDNARTRVHGAVAPADLFEPENYTVTRDQYYQHLKEEAVFSFTDHAMQRIDEMDLTPADVAHGIVHAEVDYEQPKYGANRRMAKFGEYSAAYDSMSKTVITVLYNTQSEYVRPEKAT